MTPQSLAFDFKEKNHLIRDGVFSWTTYDYENHASKKFLSGNALATTRTLLIIHFVRPQIETEEFSGIVDSVRDQVAFLTLTDQEGREIEIEWDAADLESKSIKEGQAFCLKTTTRGRVMDFDFQPVAPKLLSEEEQQRVKELLKRYRERGAFDESE